MTADTSPEPIQLTDTERLFSAEWSDMCRADQWGVVLAAALPLSILWHTVTGWYLVPAGVPWGIQLVGYEIVAGIVLHIMLWYGGEQ